VKSVEITYVGPHDSVTVERPDGSREAVKSGGTFKTTEEHAQSLLEQPANWKPSKSGGKA
jgi:hypothetical protein